MNDQIMNRRGFLKMSGKAALAAAALSAVPSFITNAIAQENVSLEHLIEKTFPEFINAGYDYAIKPTEENKKKHNALAEQLRAEEQQAISKGILAYPLRYPNQVVSPELEKKGYLHERWKVDGKNIDSYLLGKIAKKEKEGDFSILHHFPLTSTFEEHLSGKNNISYRKNNEIYINLKQVDSDANFIILNKNGDSAENILCKRICEQFGAQKEKIIKDILYTIKVHEAKGHSGESSVKDETRAILFEIKEAKSMYPVLSLLEMADYGRADELHKKASQAVMGEIAKHKNPQGQIYSGKNLALAKLDDVKKIAQEIFESRFG